jgi:predicted transcriptional regulator of viral defense system
MEAIDPLSPNMREELEERRAALVSDRKLLLTEAESLTGQIVAVDRILDPGSIERRWKIVRALQTVGGEMTYSSIHAAIGTEIRKQRLSEMLRHLREAGKIVRVGHGLYRLPDAGEPAGESVVLSEVV